jgi:hypothetical protein
MAKLRNIATIIGLAIAAIFIGAGIWGAVKYTKFGPDIMVLDTTYQRTDTGLLGLGTIHYVVSGHVKNIGSWLLPSYGTEVQMNVIANDTGTILYTTYARTTPSYLGSGDTGTFSIPFSTDDLGGYKGNAYYQVQAVR